MNIVVELHDVAAEEGFGGGLSVVTLGGAVQHLCHRTRESTLCGAFAGMAGALQVLAVFHRLIPNISSNLGFLSLLIVMLGNFNALMVLPVAAFFSVLNVGSLALPIQFQLESALAGVIQGALVLSAVIGRGLSQLAGRTGKH